MGTRQLGAAGGILAYFAQHRTAANLLLVVMLVLGITAAPQMRAQFFPDVVIESISVSVQWDGAGAEDIDSAIVQVLEPALMAVEGVEGSTSNSSEGRAQISLDFEPGWDMARAVDDVQGAVDSVSNLPEDAEDPEVRRRAWRDRVTDVVISGPVGVDQLGRLADEFTVRLFQAGVTRVTLRGVAAPETVVEVASISLIRNNVTMRELASAIAQGAATKPAGDVSGSARLRTGVEKRSADQIGDIVLRSNPDGSKLRIADVATVRTEGIDRNLAYFVGDDSAISIRVDRTDRGDAIGIQHQVEAVAAEMQLGVPQGVKIDLIRTRAEEITGRLNILLANGVMGLGFVVLLLFLFLNARTAFWVAAGIPVAMTAAIALMFAAGLTLNMISLFALIITLGIVVDDAIVVGEHADFRVRKLGETPMQGAINAAQRMFPAVFSATLTTVIAFLALVAVGGRFGDLISDIPFTVIVVLIASLAECFLILPNHMAHAMTHSAKQHWYDWPSRTVNRGFSWVRDVIFRRLMAGVIWARYPVMAGVIVVLVSQAALFIRGDVTWRFFASPEQESISGNFAMAPGATRDDTLEMMHDLQKAVEDLGAKYEAEFGRNPVDFALAQVGGTTGRGLSGADTKDADLLGSIAIELIDADLRPYSSFRFLGDLQDAVPSHPLLETLSFRRWGSGPGGDSLDVQIYGASAERLKEAAESLKTTMAQFGEVSALEDSLAYDKEEMILDLTPQGQALGVSIDALGGILRDRLNGIEAASYPDGPRSAKIRVELPPEELTADFLDRTRIRTSSGDYVNLADIVTVDRRGGFSTVRRENGLRLVSVSGDISDDDPARAAEITERLQTEILPALEENFGVTTRRAGLAEQENAFLTDAALGFGLCLLGIYLTLAWIFSSWARPMVVMAIIPFGLVGTIYGHYLWEIPVSLFSVVGMIGMTGIIINDSIVLVSTVDEYAAERGLIPAIIDGVADRLRPVFLTTATTVLGLAPLLYETSAQAQFLKPTVVTLVYGLGFGFVLVLLVVPALLVMQQDLAKQIAALRRALAFRRGARGVGAGVALVALASAAWFAMTLGAVILTGAYAPPLAGVVPGVATPALGLAMFLSGVAVLAMLAYVIGVFAVALRRRNA